MSLIVRACEPYTTTGKVAELRTSMLARVMSADDLVCNAVDLHLARAAIALRSNDADTCACAPTVRLP